QKQQGLGRKSWMTSLGSNACLGIGPSRGEAANLQPASSEPWTTCWNQSGLRTNSLAGVEALERWSVEALKRRIGRTASFLSRATMKASPRRQYQVTINSQKRKRLR